MTATLSMVPLAKIRPSEGNPRADFDDERMAELIESVKRHGIITPLTLAPDGNGGYAIIAGERRYRAAKAAKLRDVPAQVREADGDTLTLAVAENVIRADLTPVEEARAYRRLVDEHGDTAKVAKLVGKSERLIADLRHTYAALMVSAGAHPKLLQAQMGHSSIRVTLDLYGHLYPDIIGPVTQALDELISRASAPSQPEPGEEERKSFRAVR